jgi:hypothetical protein
MKRLLVFLVCLALAVGIVLGIKSIGSGYISTYLRAKATPYGIPVVSKDGRFKLVMYRYPRLNDVPEWLGFGQGFVQVEEAVSGKVLALKHAGDLAPLTAFRWSATNVIIYRVPGTNDVFADWDLPR